MKTNYSRMLIGIIALLLITTGILIASTYIPDQVTASFTPTPTEQTVPHEAARARSPYDKPAGDCHADGATGDLPTNDDPWCRYERGITSPTPTSPVVALVTRRAHKTPTPTVTITPMPTQPTEVFVTPICWDQEECGEPPCDAAHDCPQTPFPTTISTLPSEPPDESETPNPTLTSTIIPTQIVPTETDEPTATDEPTTEPTDEPTLEPTAHPTHEPHPTATEKPKCNKGEGNGGEDCDPGNNPDNGNDDEDNEHNNPHHSSALWIGLSLITLSFIKRN